MEELKYYFPDLTEIQINQFNNLKSLYTEWNAQINVISRKDLDQFYINHVLHSLAIAKFIEFEPNTSVLDIGTGGGFPGIPLAILFPEAHFHLVDSIGKKIKVVNAVKTTIGLKNVETSHLRAEELNETYDFIVSRAVTRLSNFLPWVKGKIKTKSFNQLNNGLLMLKGGDLAEELDEARTKSIVFDLKEKFKEDFFETKKLVYLPIK